MMPEQSISKTMRDVLIEAIYKRMSENERIFFVSADFGAPALDKIRKDFKDRFVNVGIAEQNLVNVSAGLALEGYTVFAYAIAPFLTMRAFEQIRLSLSITAQIKSFNINLIGVGGGMSYDIAGPTHHCLEDLSIMRTLPNLMVFSPSDWKLAENFVDYSINKKMPKYLRLDGKSVPLIYENISDFDFDSGFYELLRGEKTCLVSTGFLTHRALKIARELGNVGVIDIFMLKSFNEKLLFEALRNYECLITLEEGFINCGGLDSLVSKILFDNRSMIVLKRIGVSDRHIFDWGGRDYLHQLNDLDEKSIVKTIKDLNN